MKLISTLFLLIAGSAVAAERVPWTSSRIVGSPDPPKPFQVQRVYPQLQFTNPVEMVPIPGTNKMMLLEVSGKLFTFDDDQTCSQADLAIDLKSLMEDFRRSYSVACHPNFVSNRQIFIAYSRDPWGRPDGSRVSRFVLSEDDPPTVDPASEQVLLTWASGGHNGSAIRFDHQGYLYFSTGDGARPYPPDENDVSQDLSDLRSTICRIDVDHADGELPYSIPADNPFVSTQRARPEVWAYGFRNPWRFSFVPGTNRILCGDVGWELWELVFDVRRGGNYGWSIFEGPQPIRSDITPGPTPIQKPLVAYPHTMGQSITGGLSYQGSQYQDLRGAYLYGDYVTGLMWGLKPDAQEVTWNPILAETGLRIISFAEDRDHELLILDYDGGIFQLVRNPDAGKESDFPRQLSKTGLFESTKLHQPAAGVITYEIAAELIQPGTKSEFLVGIPDGGTIVINQRKRNWTYPTGTVFAKTISRHFSAVRGTESKRVETQILHFDGSTWQPYTYAWNADATDAALVPAEGNTVESTEAVTWRFHSRAECRSCHSRQNGGAVGFDLANLDFQSFELAGANQVDELIAMRVLDRRAPDKWGIRPMCQPSDQTCDLNRRTRSWLTANCAHCHCRGGGGTVPLDLTFSNANDQINAIDVAPTQGSFGIDDACVIKPGDPYRSVLFYRMATAGAGHMPKLSTGENDLQALQLVHDWIVSLSDRATSAETTVGMDSFASTSASLRLFAELMSQSQDERLKVARNARKAGNALTADLFERFLPQRERKQRLGDDIAPEQILALRGNAASGRQRFLDGGRQQCIQCHRVVGSGKSVGPDLDAIASKRTKQHLLESILAPSKQIEPAYNTYAVLTADGDIVTGLKISDNAQRMIIRTVDGKDHRLEKAAIESYQVQPQSIMPTGLAASMTAQELADLLAFLCSLK